MRPLHVIPTSLTAHLVRSSREEEGGGGSCVSSDRRQLTGSLTSAFGKLNVISEAEEDVSRFTPPHYSCALFLLAPPPPARRLVPQSSVSFWNMDLLPWTPCVSLNVSRT